MAPLRLLSIRMFKRIKPQLLPRLLSFFLFAQLLNPSHCDIGTASLYNPPNPPTACYGDDFTQFPSTNLFAAAGEVIWDNAAACGRQYLVRCISAVVPRTCIPGQVIQVEIVDRPQTSASMAGTTIFLSTNAFETIANSTSTSINIEFQRV